MQTRLTRYFFVGAGVFFLLLGIIGIFVPLLPTTPFLILTAYCFNKGSSKFHSWLIHHRVFGPPITDWQKSRVIKSKYKVLATGMLLLSTSVIVTKENIPFAGKITFGIFVAAALAFIWSQKSRPIG